MWARDYSSSYHTTSTWPVLMEQLRQVPLEPVLPVLFKSMCDRLSAQLARDPEEDDLLGESRLIDLLDAEIAHCLPWYGREILNIHNTCLTGWSAQGSFLVQREARVVSSVGAMLDGVATLPPFLGILQGCYQRIRAAQRAQQVPIDAVESVLDAVIAATGCRTGWQRTLNAAFFWMHEAGRVPLPEPRRIAISDWLAQSCPAGFDPEPMTRAEILSAMVRSMTRRQGAHSGSGSR